MPFSFYWVNFTHKWQIHPSIHGLQHQRLGPWCSPWGRLSGSSPAPFCCHCSVAAGCQARAVCLAKSMWFWHMSWQHVAGESGMHCVASFTLWPQDMVRSLAEGGSGGVSFAARVLQYRLGMTDCFTDLLILEIVARPGPSVRFPEGACLCSLQLLAPAEPACPRAPTAHTCQAVPAHTRETAWDWHPLAWGQQSQLPHHLPETQDDSSWFPDLHSSTHHHYS